MTDCHVPYPCLVLVQPVAQLFPHAGAEAFGTEAVGGRVGGHRHAREGGAPAGVRGAVGEALEGRAALGATFRFSVAAHGTATEASRKGRGGRKGEFQPESRFTFAAFAAFA